MSSWTCPDCHKINLYGNTCDCCGLRFDPYSWKWVEPIPKTSCEKPRKRKKKS